MRGVWGGLSFGTNASLFFLVMVNSLNIWQLLHKFYRERKILKLLKPLGNREENTVKKKEKKKCNIYKYKHVIYLNDWPFFWCIKVQRQGQTPEVFQTTRRHRFDDSDLIVWTSILNLMFLHQRSRKETWDSPQTWGSVTRRRPGLISAVD